MAKSPTEKLAGKRQALTQRTARALGVSLTEAEKLLHTPRRQSLRLNPLRGSVQATLTELQRAGWQGEPVAWAPHCFTILNGTEIVRDSLAAAEGRVFIQNAASWLPVLALEPQPGDTILDVCAAPGGKTSHIAALMGNQATITANDNSRPRLAKMRANFARLGVTSTETTLFDATHIAHKLHGQFTKILLDAPCSGEGMMQLNRDKDFATWSVAHIKRLQQLQKKMLVQAWHLLQPGGTLVYSTCTIAPEENEAIVDYLLRTRDDAEIVPLAFDLPNRVPAVREWNNRTFDPRLQHAMRLAPSPYIEAFFVAKLTKHSADET